MCRPGMRHFWTNDKKPYLCKRLTGTEVEDSTLIARVKAGDRGAFNELYGIYWASLVNYAGLFVGDDGAEDVVQDVFVRVWLRRDNLRDDGTLQGYLLRSVYHASLNALKKGANATAYRSWVAQQIEQSCYAHYDPDDSEVIRKLYSQEIAGQIDAAVESLSPKCREVFPPQSVSLSLTDNSPPQAVTPFGRCPNSYVKPPSPRKVDFAKQKTEGVSLP